MHHLLAGSQIRLTYLQDRRALAGIDWPTVFDDLTDAGMPVSRWQWCDLDALTHVVLATDRVTGRHVGALGLTEQGLPGRAALLDSWLMIDVALVRPAETGTLPRAMLAHALARIVSLDGKPVAVAASYPNRTTLSALSQSIRLAALHPPVDGNVIAFRAACLARQIGMGGTVLDLRPVPETSLLRDLRGMHGVRPERTRLDPPATSITKPARSVAATRRPRKATRTGRSG
jgi:hypothetical protein